MISNERGRGDKMRYVFTYSSRYSDKPVIVETDDKGKIESLIESYSTVFGYIEVLDRETNEIIYSN